MRFPAYPAGTMEAPVEIVPADGNFHQLFKSTKDPLQNDYASGAARGSGWPAWHEFFNTTIERHALCTATTGVWCNGNAKKIGESGRDG